VHCRILANPRDQCAVTLQPWFGLDLNSKGRQGIAIINRGRGGRRMAGLAGPVWARAVRCAAQSSAPLALRQGCAVAFAQRGHARAAHRAAVQSHTAVRARGGLIRDACGGGAPQLAMAVTRARSTQAAGDSASDSPYFAWHPSEHHGLKVHPQSVTHSTLPCCTCVLTAILMRPCGRNLAWPVLLLELAAAGTFVEWPARLHAHLILHSLCAPRQCWGLRRARTHVRTR
jgi:hypothetical protein